MFNRKFALVLAALLLVACSPTEVLPARTTTAAPAMTAAPETTAAPMTTPAPETTAVPDPTGHMQTVEEAWTALGLPDYDAWIRDSAAALIAGDGAALAETLGVPAEVYACYDGMVVTDWALRREVIPAADDPTQTRDMAVLDLTIASGGSEVLGPGEHSLVFVGELYAYFVPRGDFQWKAGPNSSTMSAAENYVRTVISLAGSGADCFDALRTPGKMQFGQADFIIARMGTLDGQYDKPRSAEEIRAYAETCLGMNGEAVSLTSVQAVDGGYVQYGRGGYSAICDFVGEEVRDGVTVVMVQFWAGYSRTVKSKRMEYHLEPGEPDFKPVKVVTLEDSGLKTAGFAV